MERFDLYSRDREKLGGTMIRGGSFTHTMRALSTRCFPCVVEAWECFKDRIKSLNKNESEICVEQISDSFTFYPGTCPCTI